MYEMSNLTEPKIRVSYGSMNHSPAVDEPRVLRLPDNHLRLPLLCRSDAARAPTASNQRLDELLVTAMLRTLCKPAYGEARPFAQDTLVRDVGPARTLLQLMEVLNNMGIGRPRPKCSPLPQKGSRDSTPQSTWLAFRLP